MAPHKVDPRKSIYIKGHLERLLASGRVLGRNPSQRIERLVARYDVLIREALPKRLELTAPELVLLGDVVKGTDLSEPDYAYVIPAKIQQLDGTGVDTSGLAYRLKNLKLGELLAVVDMVERFIGETTEPTRDGAAAFLGNLRERTRL